MNLNEARAILKQNRFILEDNMYDRAMARVDGAYQHAKDRHYDLDPLRSRHGSEAWEEGGHAEYDYTNKGESDRDEKEEFGRKVAKKLVDYFKPIYEKRGYVPERYGGGDDNWDWTIKDILDKFMYYAVGEDEKLSFMGVDEAVKYVIPTAYKVLEQCWDKKANWLDIYKFRYIDIKESKEILKSQGYICEGQEKTEEEKVEDYVIDRLKGIGFDSPDWSGNEWEMDCETDGYRIEVAGLNQKKYLLSVKAGYKEIDLKVPGVRAFSINKAGNTYHWTNYEKLLTDIEKVIKYLHEKRG